MSICPDRVVRQPGNTLRCRPLLRGKILSIASSSAIFLLFLLALASPCVQGQTGLQRIVIDADPGTDDALALLFALNVPEFKIEAVTVVPGNVVADQGLANALKIVSLAGRCDVPVARGALHPLAQQLITAEFWHGRNGLGNVELPPSQCAADLRFAPDLIIQKVHEYPYQITLIAIGPLTNIALAVSKDPSIVTLVKNIVIMGGSIEGGNVNAAAEANIYGDPEAAQIVFRAGWMITMVGCDVGERTRLTHARVSELEQAGPGPQSEGVIRIANFLLDESEKVGEEGTPMFDPLAVAVALDPTLVTTEDMHVDVETKGEFTRGETVANRRGTVERNVPHDGRYWIEGLDRVTANAHVATVPESARFLDLFVARIKGK